MSHAAVFLPRPATPNIQAGVPPENVKAMFEAAVEHGSYKGRWVTPWEIL